MARRKGIMIEDPMTGDEELKIWNERVKETEKAVKRARKFIRDTKLQDEDVLFLGALIQVLDGILYKKGV